MHQILRPLDYLRIRHDSKMAVDWGIPLSIAVFVAAAFLFLEVRIKVDVFSTNGLVQRILSFVQGLPGFYIAALAAIATFNRQDIDDVMPAPAPKLEISVSGKASSVDLSRRQFLCSMFAFLTAESILIVILAILAISVAEPVKSLIPNEWHIVIKSAVVAAGAFLFAQMTVATFWGLYFLGDRLHRADVKIKALMPGRPTP